LNSILQGKFEELIAASQEIASSTAQVSMLSNFFSSLTLL
jgi:hypothetical protein